MQNTRIPNSGKKLALADLLAGVWALATVHLFVNNVDPGDGAVAADFTEASFTGSAAVPIGTWGTVYINALGNAEANAPQISFHWTAGAVETVYGVYVLSAGAGTPLIGFARLETPKQMASTDDVLAIVPRLSFSPAGYGSFDTSSV